MFVYGDEPLVMYVDENESLFEEGIVSHCECRGAQAGNLPWLGMAINDI